MSSFFFFFGENYISMCMRALVYIAYSMNYINVDVRVITCMTEMEIEFMKLLKMKLIIYK